MSEVQFKLVKVEKPTDVNVILGQSHFIKTVEDLYEAIVGTVPGAKFGLAFSESSGPCLVRHAGTDHELVELAVRNMLNISAGHTFIILLRNLYPINILNSLRNVPEICNIYCATANPVEVIVAESRSGRGVVGVVDGQPPKGVEGEREIEERKSFLRKIGYKL
ncbi:MAG: adenosine-specific kinase [Candidatus Bathyarchaeia archaeon]|nr:adenosine-specific kinase [Candidatus Bathyarchaeota archaeon]